MFAHQMENTQHRFHKMIYKWQVVSILLYPYDVKLLLSLLSPHSYRPHCGPRARNVCADKKGRVGKGKEREGEKEEKLVRIVTHSGEVGSIICYFCCCCCCCCCRVCYLARERRKHAPFPVGAFRSGVCSSQFVSVTGRQLGLARSATRKRERVTAGWGDVVGRSAGRFYTGCIRAQPELTCH